MKNLANFESSEAREPREPSEPREKVQLQYLCRSFLSCHACSPTFFLQNVFWAARHGDTVLLQELIRNALLRNAYGATNQFDINALSSEVLLLCTASYVGPQLYHMEKQSAT